MRAQKDHCPSVFVRIINTPSTINNLFVSLTFALYTVATFVMMCECTLNGFQSELKAGKKKKKKKRGRNTQKKKYLPKFKGRSSLSLFTKYAQREVGQCKISSEHVRRILNSRPTIAVDIIPLIHLFCIVASGCSLLLGNIGCGSNTKMNKPRKPVYSLLACLFFFYTST